MNAPLTPSLNTAQNAQPDPISAVEKVLAELPASSSPGITFISAMKNAWNSLRSMAAQTNRTQGGRAAGEVLSGGADRLLTLILNFAARRAGLLPDDGAPSGFSLLAMGSYGRNELAPYSDIDILLLHDVNIPADKLELLVGNLLRPLWDAGWQVGHAVRSKQECIEAMEDAASGESAVETATSVLEARLVAGDREFGESFYKKDLPDFFKRRGRQFVDAKFEETIKRWAGLHVYRTQPNLKESPGALRDFQLAVWIDKASQLSGHLPRLNNRPLVSKAAIDDAQAGYERLLTFRVSLHAHCRRKQDVLDFAMQQTVAEDLGYVGTDELRAQEQLLRDYYRAAKAVHRLAQTVTRRYLEERAVASRDIERLKRRKVDPEFTRIGDYLYASRDDLFSGKDWLELAFRAFLHTARLNISISQDMAEAIRSRLPEMNDKLRANPAAASHFGTLIRFRDNVAKTLREMRDIGLLGAYMPEFSEIEGLVLSDVFHDYTVDEHTLYVVEAADRLYKSVESFDRFRRSILESLPRPQLLRLACLFHDLGKCRGAPGHSERGALMMPQIGERLHLNAADVRTLIFLVQEHLTLSKVSQRRDTGEGTLLKRLADKIGTKERLDLLFLLTYCDSISVGHGSYPLWKDALLAELYHGILQFIKMPAGSTENTSIDVNVVSADQTSALEAAILKRMQTEEDRALTVQHFRRVPTRYLVEVNEDEALLHLDALRRMRDSGKEAVAAVQGTGGLVDMWVVSTDRPKRFSQICGAFLGAGVTVISALAYTRDDGVILDHFRLAPGLDSQDTSEQFWQKVASGVEDTLLGKGDFLARIEAARKRIPRTPAITRRVDPEVRVDNKLSDRFTVVDVICGDRIGLLYGLSRALADLSCDIHFAKISTNQGLVTDVFYISEVGGGQITDAEKMLNVKRLLKAVAADFQEAYR
ncbi:MAG TPA: [protein-PII] uridylyltransferase [Planctomycetota bacterium]|nr:[protein-PII] uridylyltransferase [Planctomycetota bacterium]